MFEVGGWSPVVLLVLFGPYIAVGAVVLFVVLTIVPRCERAGAGMSGAASSGMALEPWGLLLVLFLNYLPFVAGGFVVLFVFVGFVIIVRREAKHSVR